MENYRTITTRYEVINQIAKNFKEQIEMYTRWAEDERNLQETDNEDTRKYHYEQEQNYLETAQAYMEALCNLNKLF